MAGAGFTVAGRGTRPIRQGTLQLGGLLSCALVANSALAAPVACGLSPAFSQADERDGEVIQRQIWRQAGGALIFASPLNVNTDGNAQSYPALHKFPSLTGLPARYNIICNGVTLTSAAGVYAGPDTEGGCGIINRQVVRMGNKPVPWLVEKGDPKIKWVAVPTFAEGDRILPCVAGNYYVSMTNVASRPTRSDGSPWKPCDQAQWLDSAVIPAIVIPRNSLFLSTYSVRSGDSVALFRPAEQGRPERLVFGIVGDSGPAKKLGEATLAAHAGLVGSAVPKAESFDPAGNIVAQISTFGVKGTVITLVFPKTMPSDKILDNPQVNADRAKARFSETLGGSNFDVALQWLRRCASEVR